MEGREGTAGRSALIEESTSLAEGEAARVHGPAVRMMAG